MSKAYTKQLVVGFAKAAAGYRIEERIIDIFPFTDCFLGQFYLTPCEDALNWITLLEPTEDESLAALMAKSYARVNALEWEKSLLLKCLSGARHLVPDFISVYRAVSCATPLSIYVWLRYCMWPDLDVDLSDWGLSRKDMGILSKYKNLAWLQELQGPYSLTVSVAQLVAGGGVKKTAITDSKFDDLCEFFIGKPLTIEGRRSPRIVEIAGCLLS